ncbi:helix-turn-helix domain-containing protein [Acutalibacter muris]|uniref:Helix-turn-helix domain-containing protein n=1 Tax=Acutalibacter muris TaxID=1796620 RepID=A0A1Z2XPE2_9FIRM|nr:helix-turn-helix domain-containing protein [Acutalibacter muris]ANU53011.1 hypothetical protein A4V00_02665 [Hungateiclostridiaceae bacterium KB18]ASB40313.1 helix-turn-helix domain-containing protein [Acutalibacter muris]QQR29604.1 helix-turn-helix domain-containing protein [Acutalibacter muris]
MNAIEFRTTLTAAVNGNNDALANIIELYIPLINSRSYVDGELDEDLRQYILLHIIKNISKFSL